MADDIEGVQRQLARDRESSAHPGAPTDDQRRTEEVES
jgi:hypothetical protein